MDVEKFAQAIAQKAEQDQADKNMEALIKVNSAVYSRAMAYTNLIVAVGYAGVFTVWNFTRDQLAPDATLYVAALLVISIAFYVAFEISKMLVNSEEIFAFKAVLNAQVKAGARPIALAKTIAEYGARQERRTIGLAYVWLPILWITIGTAFAAGLILVGNFVVMLCA